MTIEVQELLVVLCEPESTSAERIRSLRTNLARLVPHEAPIIGVCSTWPREGKSSIAANLAAAFAQVRSGAVLIDGDLRRPTLSAMAQVAHSQGLADYLRAPSTGLQSKMIATDAHGLSIIPAGNAEESSVNLLAGKPLEQGLQSLRADGLPVVIDTPPLSVGSDALLIGTHCDGVILVIHAKRWEGKAELESKMALEDHGIRILGVVLNDVRENGASYYGDYYQPRQKGHQYRSRSRD